MNAGTELLYRDDPYLLEFEATVSSRRLHQGQPAVVLDRTAFYPEGGGQPWDTGTLDGCAVLAAIQEDGAVLHVLDRYPEADRVRGRVDAARRRDHRQQHHGQHLLSRALFDHSGARTVSFHLGAEVSTIDLDTAIDETALCAAETRTNEVVWEARPVRVRTLRRAEARALGIEPPDEAGDAVRLIEVEGFDSQACGGTHPRSTAEVGLVLGVGRERYKGASRVHFVCGHRALALVRRRAGALEKAGSLLSSAPDEVPHAVERLLGQLAQAQEKAQGLLKRALDGEARRLLAAPRPDGGPIVALYQGWTAGELRALAQQLVALAPSVALLGSAADKAHLVFAQTAGLPHDIPALLQDALRLIGGRGGGRGDLAQGGGERVEALPEALETAARRVRDRSPSG